jgi:hypothetical protein
MLCREYISTDEYKRHDELRSTRQQDNASRKQCQRTKYYSSPYMSCERSSAKTSTDGVKQGSLPIEGDPPPHFRSCVVIA